MYNHDSFINLKDINPEFTKNICEKKEFPPLTNQKAEHETSYERNNNRTIDEFKAAVLITAMMLKREGI